MLYATNIFPGDGSTRQFEITFVGGYLNKSHVKVYVEDAVTKMRRTIDMGAVTWIGPYTIQLPEATTVGSNTVIARKTPLLPIVDFQGSSRITEANLDVAHRQGLFVATESLDSTNSKVVEELKEVLLNTETWEQAAADAATASAQAGVATTKAAEAASSAAASAASAGALALSTGSGNVGHIGLGPGAVATTVSAKLRETVSITADGAVGDYNPTTGVGTDNTAKIQSIINRSIRGVITGAPGKFLVSSPLIIPHGFTFDGCGMELYSKGSFLFRVENGVTVDRLCIKNFYCENVTSAKGGNDFCPGIYVDLTGSLINSEIKDNEFVGYAFGMSLQGSLTQKTYVPAYNSNYTTLGTDGRNMVTGNIIRDSRAQTRIGTGGGHGIFIRSGYFHVIGNRIENMQGSILGPTYGVVSNNIILNAFDDNGIYLSGSKNVSVVGNYIEKCIGDGISLNNCENITVSGNTIVNAGISGIRLQMGFGHNICGNTIINPVGSYMRVAIASGSPDGPYNINIVGNVFKGVTVGNPFSFGDTPTGLKYRNWRIANNMIDGVDTTSLVSPFYGPYLIVNFGDLTGTKSLIVENNTFSNVKEAPRDSQGNYQYIKATRESSNVIEHADGYTTVPVIDTAVMSGGVRFACGASGAVLTPSYSGFVTAITIGTSGVYTVTFDRPRKVTRFSWTGSLANAPSFVRMSVTNPAESDDVVSSVDVTFYTLAGVATYPNYLASMLLNFTAGSGGISGTV